MLNVEKLSVIKAGKALVKNISFHAKPGTITAIIGPNGAGKTSLFRAITGEWSASKGTVTIQGKERNCWPRKQLATQLSVMGQSPHVAFDFTVAELVHLGRAPHRGNSSPLNDRLVTEAAIKLAGLDRLQNRTVPSLSGGERQRTFFAKAVAQIMSTPNELPNHGRIMLLDEPTSALDLPQQARVMEASRKIARSGGCIVIILHDLNLASAFADQIVMIKNGTMYHNGTPQAMLTYEKISDCYGCHVEITHKTKTSPAIISLPNHHNI